MRGDARSESATVVVQSPPVVEDPPARWPGHQAGTARRQPSAADCRSWNARQASDARDPLRVSSDRAAPAPASGRGTGVSRSDALRSDWRIKLAPADEWSVGAISRSGEGLAELIRRVLETPAGCETPSATALHRVIAEHPPEEMGNG